MGLLDDTYVKQSKGPKHVVFQAAQTCISHQHNVLMYQLWSENDIHYYMIGGGGGVLHHVFGSWVQHMKIIWTQSDLRFCENLGSIDLKSVKKGVNLIENQGQNLYKIC